MTGRLPIRQRLSRFVRMRPLASPRTLVLERQLVRSIVALMGLATTVGCLPDKSPPPAAKPRARVENPFDLEQGELIDEQWEAHYVRGAKLGHRKRQTFRLDFPMADEVELVQRVTIDDLELRRFNTVIRQKLISVSIESLDGTVKQLGYQVQGSGSQSMALGEIVDGVLTFQRVDGEQKTDFQVKWDPSDGGIFAVEKSLSANPMKVGDERVVKAFVPLVDRAVTFDLVAKKMESTKLGSETRELLRIEATDRGGDTTFKIPTVHWVDDQGQIVKTTEAFLNRETRLVDEREANRANETYRIDLGIDTGVALNSPIAEPDSTNLAVYRVRVDGLEPSKIFPNSVGQRVLDAEPGVALITVQTVSPTTPESVDVEVAPPTDDDLATNALIQSDHPRVKALAGAVVSDSAAADSWRAATSLQRYLFGSLKKNDYSQVFSAAGDVAKRKQGDCSEHAVLLAAACRSRGIPARVAVGMIYSPKEQSFLYHMWNEVWVKDRWVPLDATRRESGTNAIYLKMRDSNLAHQTAYSVVSPIIHLMDRIKIEVVSTSDTIE